MKVQTNIHVSQVRKLFLTRKFSNRAIYFAVLVFTQIRDNFHFLVVFTQKCLKTFIEKMKRLTVRIAKFKTYGATSNQYI